MPLLRKSHDKFVQYSQKRKRIVDRFGVDSVRERERERKRKSRLRKKRNINEVASPDEEETPIKHYKENDASHLASILTPDVVNTIVTSATVTVPPPPPQRAVQNDSGEDTIIDQSGAGMSNDAPDLPPSVNKDNEDIKDDGVLHIDPNRYRASDAVAVYVKSKKSLRHPFLMCITGPSQCGKTTYIGEILGQCANVISPPPEAVYFFHNTATNVSTLSKKYGFVRFEKGCPTAEELQKIREDNGEKPVLVILDDLLDHLGKNHLLKQIATVMCHHLNMSFIVTGHNYYDKNNDYLTAKRNSRYIVLFQDRNTDGTVIPKISQDREGYRNFLPSVLRHAARHSPYNNLLMENDTRMPKREEYSTNGQNFDQPTIYYCPSSGVKRMDFDSADVIKVASA